MISLRTQTLGATPHDPLVPSVEMWSPSISDGSGIPLLRFLADVDRFSLDTESLMCCWHSFKQSVRTTSLSHDTFARVTEPNYIEIK